MRTRQAIPDLLKGFAVLMMVQVHIMELIMAPEIMQAVGGKLSLFMGGVPAAPIFMVIMGYFVSRSDKRPKIIAKRGLKLILWGLLLNIGLNLHLLIRVFQGSLEVNPYEYIFGVDILFLAGLSLIFIALIRYTAGSRFWVFLSLTFIVPLIAELTPFVFEGEGVWKYLTAYFISNASWSYFPFFPWAGWVLVGYSFGLLEKYLKQNSELKKYIIYMIYISGIPVLALLPWAITISTNLHLYYHHGILFFVWALFFCLLWIQLFKWLHRLFPAGIISVSLQWLGRNVTAIYVVQWLIIGNLATAIYRSQTGIIFWFLFIGVMAISSLLVYLFSKALRANKASVRNPSL